MVSIYLHNPDWKYLIDVQGARQYSIEEYQKIGQKRFKEVFDQLEDPGERAIEAEFWHTISSAQNFTVQYGSDVEGTAVSDTFHFCQLPFTYHTM